MPARRKVLGAVLALLLVTAVAVVGWRWWSGRDTTDLQRAMALAPADGQRFSFTDWAGVRAELGSEVDADSSADEVNALLDEAFDADLASTSALVDSAETLQSRYGFSPASLEWELFSQGEAGAVAILEVADGGVADVAERLTELGYDEPADETGVWTGGDTLLAQIGGVTPVLAHVALDEDRGLVLASDNVDYLRGLVEEDDTGLSGLDDDGVDAAVDAAGEPVTAAVYTGDHVCRALAMAQADPADAAEGERLVDEAGGVHPLTGFVMGTQPGGDVRVAMALEDEDRARADADARATLAAGPAPGQGGDFADRFELGRVAAEGAVVTMELQPTPGSYVLSDLSTGPVLFATC